MITNIFVICGILFFASVLIVAAYINIASSKGRDHESEDWKHMENVRKQKK